MMRTLALAGLALLLGVVAGATGANSWVERQAETESDAARIVVTAGGDWYGLLDHEGCSAVPVDVYNAGERPIAVSRFLVSVSTAGSLTCRPEVGDVTIPPHTTRTVRAVVGFRCSDALAEPRFTATIGEEESEPVSGSIEMPPLDHGALCQDNWAVLTPSWYRSESKPVSGKGSSARLPITLVFGSAEGRTKLASLTMNGSKAFRLHPPRLPIDLGTLAPGAATPEVPVDLSLSVRDCARARAFTSTDLAVTASFAPSGERLTQGLADFDRIIVQGLLRLVDAAC